MIRSRIIGTGRFLPERIRTNAEMEKLCDTTDEWIRKRTGILQRHVSNQGDGTADIATPAARAALANAGVHAEDVDVIICCTTTPDYIFPATGSIVQERLGLRSTPAFDVNAACSGFMYGLACADSFIRSGLYRTVLLIGAEVANNRINYGKRDTAVLFGDGAAAVVLRGENGEAGILTIHLWSDGSGREILWLPAGGSKIPLTHENIDTDLNTIHMQGPELFRRAVVEFSEAIRVALETTCLTIDDIDAFVPHQANVRIIEAVAERLGLPAEKCCVDIDRVGNCVAASIPLAIDHAIEEGKIKPGSMVLLASFGAGLTWASSIIRW